MPCRFAPRNDEKKIGLLFTAGAEIQKTKIKSVGISGCDCHDILSASLAMTKEGSFTMTNAIIFSVIARR